MTTATATPVEQNGNAPYGYAAAATGTGGANGTAAVAAAGADEAIQFLTWRIEPHLVDNYLVAAGRLTDMTRLLDPLAGESAAFNVYRRESYDGNPLELVAVIVPQRHNGQPWPDEMDSGAQIVTAQEYLASGDSFVVLANLGRLLSDEDKHGLMVWGATPGRASTVLDEQEIHRYRRSRLPQVSFLTKLRRWARIARRMLASIWKSALIVAAAGVGLGVVALAIIGAVVVIQPEWMGLEIVDKAQWLLSFLPWHGG